MTAGFQVSSANVTRATSVAFTIDLAPFPKHRPRFGNGHAYTNGKTRAFEHDAGLMMKLAMGRREPFTAPLSVAVDFIYARPKSNKDELPVTKPDIDNTLKSLFDAGNGIVWVDDKLICEVIARKSYGDKACIKVQVNEAVKICA